VPAWHRASVTHPNLLTQLLEKLKRPGLLGLIGRSQEKRCQKQLHSYFQELGRRIAGMKLEQLADPQNGAPPVPGQKPPALELSKESIDALHHFADSLREVMTT